MSSIAIDELEQREPDELEQRTRARVLDRSLVRLSFVVASAAELRASSPSSSTRDTLGRARALLLLDEALVDAPLELVALLMLGPAAFDDEHAPDDDRSRRRKRRRGTR